MADKEGKDENKTVKEIERLAREQAKNEAKESKEAKALEAKSRKETEAADKKAKKEAERLAKEKAKKEAEEAKRAKKEAERLAKEQAKEAPPPPSGGNYQLILPSSVGFKPLKQFTDHLAGVKDLKIIWTGGSTDEGILIAVSVAPSVPLAQILSDMPMVEGVEVKGEKITIMPKFSI